MSTFEIELYLWEIQKSLNEIKQADHELSLYFKELLEISNSINQLLEVLQHG